MLEFAAVSALCALMFMPMGTVIVRALIPEPSSGVVHWGLAAGVGYAVCPLVVTTLGAVRLLSFYLPLCLLVLIIAVVLTIRHASARRIGGNNQAIAEIEPTFVLLTIVSLSAVAVIPLMTPLKELAPGQFRHYAYVDEFYHLALVQGLVRDIPLADWPSLSGMRPEFYTVYHHTVLAAIARIAHVPSLDVVVVYARLIGVVMTTVLAYGIGDALTGSRWAGLMAASLPNLVLVPNIYDRNLWLAGQAMVFHPNFYQLHFYSLRYASHSISGDVLTLTAMLAVAIALAADDHRRRIGALTLAGATAALLLQTRGQFALVVLPMVGLVQCVTGFRQRRWAYLIPVSVTLAVVAAITLSVRTPGSRADLMISYGVFGASAARDGFLPTVVREGIARFPALMQPLLGVSALVGLRFVGANVVALLLWAWWTGVFRGPARPFALFLLGVIVTGWAASLFVEQRGLPGNIGINVLSGLRMPVLMLAAIPLFALIQRFTAWRRWRRPGLLLILALVAATAVTTRGANAALKDQSPRAYDITADEFATYRWVTAHSTPETIVAAHPDHRVNERGEMIRSSNLLSAMTDRPVYVQRIAGFTYAEGQRRAAILRDFFSASSGAEACAITARERFDLVLEWPSEPLTSPERPCLTLVYSGIPRVYQVRPLDAP